MVAKVVDLQRSEIESIRSSERITSCRDCCAASPIERKAVYPNTTVESDIRLFLCNSVIQMLTVEF